MVRKIILCAISTALLMTLYGCKNAAVTECQRCHEVKATALRLIGNVDMQLCEECYDQYIAGEWGDEDKA